MRAGAAVCGHRPKNDGRRGIRICRADCITVPSHFANRSFLSQGVAPEKISLLPYGVDLSKFGPTGVPTKGKFDILFAGVMSLRKGIHYLA